MNSIKISTNEIRLAVNDDPNRIISFDPTDIGFVEKYYALLGKFEKKEVEFEKRNAELQDNKELDKFGVAKNFGPRVALLKDICTFMRDEIDEIFGSGASQAAFGSANTLDMFEQFFDGIAPYIEKARAGKVQKYLQKSTGNVMQ